MRGKHQRHQQLRGRTPDADRDHDHHRQQRGDRAVDADQRGEQRNEHHRQDQQPGAALARSGDQKLAGPGGHTGNIEPRADDEQRGDEDDRGIAKAAERLLELKHAGRPQRERRADRDEHDRNTVRDEQDDNAGDDREGGCGAAQAVLSVGFAALFGIGLIAQQLKARRYASIVHSRFAATDHESQKWLEPVSPLALQRRQRDRQTTTLWRIRAGPHTP